MRVLHVTAEAFPLARSGGLADVAVAAALPAALNLLQVDARLLLPGYRQAVAHAPFLQEVARLGDVIGCGETRLLATWLPGSRVPVWLVDCPALYDRPGGVYQDPSGCDWHDNAERFALLSHVAARIYDGLGEGTRRPDDAHCHDWHAAPVQSRAGTVPAADRLAEDPDRRDAPGYRLGGSRAGLCRHLPDPGRRLGCARPA